MTAAELLTLLESLGMEVTAAEGKLRINSARGQLSEDLRAAVAARKTQLLELLGNRSLATAAVPRIPRDADLPLSFFQERLWVLNAFEPDNTAYNMVIAWPSASPVDADRVVAAIRTVAERHEMVRARFRETDGRLSIALVSANDTPIEVRDLRELSLDEQRDAVDETIDQCAHTPFDLSSDAPIRFIVFRAAQGHVVTLVAAHHIALDAWSFNLLKREITAAYEGGPLLGQAELDFVDFAGWQRRVQDRRLIGPDVAWWKERLTGAPPVSTLPADGVRAADARGATYPFEFSHDLSAGLRGMVRGEGATVYMALVAACAAALHWYTGQDDLVLGSPMGTRDRAEFERIVGPFVNVLLLRLDLADNPTFAELLARTRDAVLEAHAHRGVSFENIVEQLNPLRSTGQQPLFQVAVVQHNAVDDADLRIEGGGALFDLTWFVRESEGRLVGGLEYRTDLYTAETIARLATRLEAILTSAVSAPQRRLSELSLVSADESARVLAHFNATAVDLDPRAFAEQFEAQAAATPDARAASFAHATLTYRELNERANQIARHLQTLGIGPGVVVGLCLTRSLDMLVALIAIHKSGGAYVPLDPDFPVERLSFMLGDSDARVLVVNGALPRGLALPSGVSVVDLGSDAARASIAALQASDLTTHPKPNDLAYLMYTSGSTGKPKGVCVPHGALSNFLGSMRREPGIDASDTLAAVTTLSFDIAGLELYLPLIAGAHVVIVSRATAADGLQLADLLASSGSTVLQATPATWRMLVEAGWSGPPGFKALTGGEPLSPDLAEVLVLRVGELWNMYGPTETTVWSTISRVHAGEPISIGKPIANTSVYVLDTARRLMPPGVPGELWIGGAGVATGYHARPELTHDRFVVDPFVRGTAGARMYRTGDRARWREDGTIEHLGRVDFQIKVRGYRIEPGEIESVLESHASIRQAVVIARQQDSGDVRLVAYLVYARGEDLSVSEVRRLLRTSLPDYMVPALFVTLDAMPLTPNGKVDRKALPNPFAQMSQLTNVERSVLAPGMESVLADIWRSTLQIPAVGADDNFFDLGGHSLLALRVASAVRQRTGWQMDPRLLFFRRLRQIAAAAPVAGTVEPAGAR